MQSVCVGCVGVAREEKDSRGSSSWIAWSTRLPVYPSTRTVHIVHSTTGFTNAPVGEASMLPFSELSVRVGKDVKV